MAVGYPRDSPRLRPGPCRSDARSSRSSAASTTATRWPVGIALTSWRYMWRTTPLYRTEEEGSVGRGRAAAAAGRRRAASDVQRAARRRRPAYHRRYAAVIRDSPLSADGAHRSPDRRSRPRGADRVRHLQEARGRARRDERRRRVRGAHAGAWDGPVRVIERTPTLLPAGHARGPPRGGPDRLLSASRATAAWCSRSSPGRAAATASPTCSMTACACRRRSSSTCGPRSSSGVIELSGGRARRRPAHPHAARRGPAPVRGDGARALRDKPLNFDSPSGVVHPGAAGTSTTTASRCRPRRRGRPSPAAPGSGRRELMRDYEFADPRIVRAIYAPDSALEGRDMLLEARFWGLRFRFGVRVGGVVDETRTSTTGARCASGAGATGRSRATSRWARWTTQVWKWLDDGSGRVPHPRRVAPGPHPQPADPAGVPAVRPPGAGQVRPPRLRADGRGAQGAIRNGG